jgi:glycosyltransferase involved in cell wall biosynthesis
VLAYPSGAVPELVTDGVTGFLCSDVASLCNRVIQAATIDRAVCRQRVKDRFSVRTMTDAYELAYQNVLAPPEPAQDDCIRLG